MCEAICYRINWWLHKSLYVVQTGLNTVNHRFILLCPLGEVTSASEDSDGSAWPTQDAGLNQAQAPLHSRTISSCSSGAAAGLGSSSTLCCLATGPAELGSPLDHVPAGPLCVLSARAVLVPPATLVLARVMEWALATRPSPSPLQSTYCSQLFLPQPSQLYLSLPAKMCWASKALRLNSRRISLMSRPRDDVQFS